MPFDLPLLEGREEPELNMAQQWLSRSGGLPITFTLGKYLGYGTSHRSHPCIKLLAAHVHRWQDVTFNSPYDTTGDLRNIQHNLTLLNIGWSFSTLETSYLDLFAGQSSMSPGNS